MLSFILRTLGFVLIAWLFRKLLNVFSGSQRAGGAKSRAANPTNHMVKDPVCGMYMDSRLALRVENKHENFYFCSEECKRKYTGKSDGAAEAL
jgi:YHS domain-containing protein